MKLEPIRMVLAAAAASAWMLATPATAQNWDMATPYPEANFHEQNILQFAKDVEQATNGKLTISVHTGNSLIPHPEIKNAVRNGTVPMGEFLLGRLANESPIYELDLLPFAVDGYDEAKKMWDASRPVIEKKLAQQNLKVLFAVPWPTNGLYSNKPLESVEDLRGLKLRTYNATTDRLAQLTGAVPTQVEVPDIPQAFATGRVDALITSASTGVSISAWDFVKRYTKVNSFLGKNIVVVNARMFDALSKEEQDALMKAAATAEQRGWQLSEQNNADAAKTLAEHQMTVEDASPELVAGLQKVGAEMLTEWRKRAGPEGEDILKAMGK